MQKSPGGDQIKGMNHNTLFAFRMHRISSPKLSSLLCSGYFILLALSLLAVFFAGCGPEVITIDTRVDYVDESDLIEAPGVYISSVMDNREQGAAMLGHITGQVSHNKTDIYLADSLSALIKNYYNDLLVNHTRTIPVDIVINSFSLVENFSKKDEYHLIGSLSYNYTDEGGTPGIIRFIHQQGF